MYLGMEQLKTMDFFREMSREEKVALTKVENRSDHDQDQGERMDHFGISL